jgi:hypothetical protein
VGVVDEQGATLGVGREHRVHLEARVGGEAGEVEVAVDDLAHALDEVGVHAAVGLAAAVPRATELGVWAR